MATAPRPPSAARTGSSCRPLAFYRLRWVVLAGPEVRAEVLSGPLGRRRKPRSVGGGPGVLGPGAGLGAPLLCTHPLPTPLLARSPRLPARLAPEARPRPTPRRLAEAAAGPQGSGRRGGPSGAGRWEEGELKRAPRLSAKPPAGNRVRFRRPCGASTLASARLAFRAEGFVGTGCAAGARRHCFSRGGPHLPLRGPGGSRLVTATELPASRVRPQPLFCAGILGCPASLSRGRPEGPLLPLASCPRWVTAAAWMQTQPWPLCSWPP